MFKKRTTVLLSFFLAITIGLTACNNGDNKESETPDPSQDVNVSNSGSTTSEVAEEVVVEDQEEIKRIERYIDMVVNGPFREYISFPNFTSVQEIPIEVYAGNGLLTDALQRTGLKTLPRSSYQAYLQERFHPDVTLSMPDNNILAYDRQSDSYNVTTKESARNFTPFSIWLEPVLKKAGNTYQYEAYELSYEFVNSDTGRNEKDNPLARMVVDGVTIGYSTPSQRQDLHLIDHRQLAKTRYTLSENEYGLNLVSKSNFGGDAVYKASALPLFQDQKASFGVVSNLEGGVLAVRNWASADASISGNLIEGNYVYYVNAFPDTPYYLAAPASQDPYVFNYKLGFGFMTAEYIK